MFIASGGCTFIDFNVNISQIESWQNDSIFSLYMLDKTKEDCKMRYTFLIIASTTTCHMIYVWAVHPGVCIWIIPIPV